jgi:hypothetical protein
MANRLEHETLLNNIYKLTFYLTENTFHFYYEDQLINDAHGKSRCLFWESYGTQKYNLWRKFRSILFL